jgi:hypothetical protein
VLEVERAPVFGGDQSGRQRNGGKCIPGKVGVVDGHIFTGSPPKVATACKANIRTAKAISLFIFVLDSIPEREQRKAWEQ